MIKAYHSTACPKLLEYSNDVKHTSLVINDLNNSCIFFVLAMPSYQILVLCFLVEKHLADRYLDNLNLAKDIWPTGI
jgi:hypothetical protein